MQRTAYIIPGFTEKTSEKPYREIARMFSARGIKPILVRIDWKHRTMSDYLNQFLEEFHPKKGSIVLGFSYGSMIALLTSLETKPKTLILCSLSPWFKEDLPSLKTWWKEKIAGKNRVENLETHSFNAIAKKTKTKTILLVGAKEHGSVQKRIKDARKKIRNSELIVIPNAKHKIAQPEYQQALKELIETL